MLLTTHGILLREHLLLNSVMGVSVLGATGKFERLFLRYQRLIINSSFILLAIIFAWPIMGNPNVLAAGDDSLFHLSRIYSLAQSLGAGQFLPGYDFMAFHSVGTAMNLFYPYVTTALPIVLLKYVVGHWASAIGLYYVGITLLTLVVTYKCTLALTTNRLAAYIFSICYNFSIYRIDVAYPRFDLGELVVFLALPLALIGFELMLQKQDYGKWTWLVFGFSLMLYAHLLSALLVALLLGLRLAFGWRQVTKDLGVSLCKAFIWSILIGSYQLITLLEQCVAQPLHSIYTGGLLTILKDPAELLSNSINNSIYVYTIGLLGVVALGLIVTNFDKLTYNGVNYGVWACFGIGAFILTSKLFPWRYLVHTPAAIIQYPYRLSLFATFFLIMVGAVVLAQLIGNYSPTKIVPMLSLLLLIVVLFARSNADVLHKTKLVLGPRAATTFQLQHYKDGGTDDYLPQRAKHQLPKLWARRFYINDHATTFKIKADPRAFTTTVKTAKPDTLVDLPILYYVGAKISTAAGKLPVTPLISSRGTVAITLPKAGVHRLQVTYQPTVKRQISAAVAFISLASFCLQGHFPAFKKFLT
ncbi:MAG: hypothetical protein LKF36_14445 [Lactobacillus sp.]|jgi:hypothetical protein|nr:hypothetical protein [Lactobacillus sp.]